jgi:HK97 family phage major capsid protein
MYLIDLTGFDPARLANVFAMADTSGHEQLVAMQEKRLDLLNKTEVIVQIADSEKRPLTDAENQEIQETFADIEKLGKEIEQRKKILDFRTDFATSQGRLAAPNSPGSSAAGHMPGNVDDKLKGKNGYESFGAYALDVHRFSKPGNIQNAPTTFSSEGIGADGGFAVPPDFRDDIWQKVAGEDSLLKRTDQYNTARNAIVFPADETTPWDPVASGGIQCYFESEAAQIPQSKVAFQQKTVRLNKCTCLIPITSELLEDTSALDSYLRKKAAEKFDFKINLKMVAGVGVGEPLGILNAPSLATVGKDPSGQAAKTITGFNIMDMWASLYAPCRRNAVWLINQDTETQLMRMFLPFTTVAGTENVGGWPLYIPAGGLSNSPNGTLMGRPIVPTQACSALGTPGDIILVDLMQYITAVKTGEVKVDVSMHLWFDYDVMAYRFILRVGGQPWWMNEITPLNDATNLLSWAVVLPTR